MDKKIMYLVELAYLLVILLFSYFYWNTKVIGFLLPILPLLVGLIAIHKKNIQKN
ncbi:hypothetical protein [Alkalibacterium sp. 20]|uniref:hypothetical protein n=1 Tax=Alkalibacterium sp. 20 TaxID=1798803 RepID=UPI000A7E0B4C|nr:hypothetical protein [Alkalibacterium sp. 20]